MAVYGNLKDFPFADILGMISAGSGRFCIRNHSSGKVFEFFIRFGQLKALFIDSAPATDVLMIRSWVAKLVTANSGDFEFVREQVGEYGDYGDYSLPLNQLVASGFANTIEWETLKEFCPNPETIFLLSLGPVDCWMEPELENFLDDTRILLEEGASGEHLAIATGYPLEEVLLKLYKLKATHVITPMRSYRRDEQLVDIPTSAEREPAARGLWNAQELPVPKVKTQPLPPPPEPVKANLHLSMGVLMKPEAAQTHNVLGRFLDGLRKRLHH